MIVSHFQTWDDILFSQFFSIDFTIFVSRYNMYRVSQYFSFFYKKYDDVDLKKILFTEII